MITNKKGETIVETLVAILIVALCFLMLQESVVTAAKINATSDDKNAPFVADKNVTSCSLNIKSSSKTININDYYNCYKTEKGYYYYEHN